MTNAEPALYRNATVIEGTGAGPIQSGALLTDRDGRIAWVGPEADLPRLESGTTTVDLGGGTLLPGFIDCHVHVTIPSTGSVDFLHDATLPRTYRTFLALQPLRATLHAGVTTARDLGGADLGVKMAVEEGLIEGPRLIIAISLMGITGGHGDSTYASGFDITGEVDALGIPAVADGVDGCRLMTRRLLRAGADVIKIASTGGVWSPRDQPEHGGLTEEETRVVVEEARRHGGKKVATHAQGREGIAAAVRAGVASVEHGYQLDVETAERMKAEGIYLVPTLSTATREPDETRAPAYAYEKKMKWIRIARECLPPAIATGVKVAMGTDAGIAAHGRNLEELERMVEFGLTPMEAIVAGTSNAADLLGLAGEVGALKPGLRADLVVSNGDPLRDLTALSDPDNVVMVVKDGCVVKDLRHVEA
jgi:imidazolonepropionase-like amidohydrolase